MLVYLIKRLLLGLGVLVLVLVFMVLIVHLVPGDPGSAVLGQHATPETLAAVRVQMGLNQSIPEQVWTFVSGAAVGDLGTDFVQGIPVRTLIWQTLPNTLVLAFTGLALAIGCGLALGVRAARNPGGVIDRVLGAASILLISTPAYVAGLGLLLIFAVVLPWLPSIGTGTISDPVGYGRHLILPAVALALGSVGYVARFVRANILEVSGTNYVRTARALGLREKLVFRRYIVKNALIPVMGLFGLMLGGALAGTVYVEVIFNRPGLGSLAFNALYNRDWPLIRACVVLYAVFFVLGNLLADLSYRWLDPRLRSDYSV